MTNLTMPEAIPISALNALSYCPRRYYYQFVQGDTGVNEYVLEGTILHRRVHEASMHAVDEGVIQTTRLYLYSEQWHLTGFADVIEEQEGVLIPVEYKHGKQGQWLNDHIQLCAQALCLEERRPDMPPIAFGYIYYVASRHRIQVDFTAELRTKTQDTITLAFQVAALEKPPEPLDGPLSARCPNCSLISLCLPDEVKLLQSKKEAYRANTLLD